MEAAQAVPASGWASVEWAGSEIVERREWLRGVQLIAVVALGMGPEGVGIVLIRAADRLTFEIENRAELELRIGNPAIGDLAVRDRIVRQILREGGEIVG